VFALFDNAGAGDYGQAAITKSSVAHPKRFGSVFRHGLRSAGSHFSCVSCIS